MSLRANDDNILVNNLTNILQNIRELEAEAERSGSGLKNLLEEIDRDEEIRKKVSKDLTEFVNKYWQEPKAF